MIEKTPGCFPGARQLLARTKPSVYLITSAFHGRFGSSSDRIDGGPAIADRDDRKPHVCDGLADVLTAGTAVSGYKY